MHIIEILIHQFLAKVARGQALIDPSLYQKFSQDADVLLQKQFAREPKEFTLRMSNLGRPSCQLEYEAMGISGDHVAADIVRNLYGDLTERIMMFILHASGVPIIEEQKSVSLNIANTNISGTLDIVVDFDDSPKVWDIKSASEWTFKNKLNKSFEEIYAEDIFGYIPQLFLYGEAYGCKVGGLIVFNKSSSEIRVIEAPTNQRLLRKRALREVEDKINFLAGKEYSSIQSANPVLDNFTTSKSIGTESTTTASPTISTNIISTSSSKPTVSKCFESAPEYFRSKPTGNQVAAFTCTMCPWRFKCWPSLVLKPKAQSKAKEPSLVYYTEYHE